MTRGVLLTVAWALAVLSLVLFGMVHVVHGGMLLSLAVLLTVLAGLIPRGSL